MLYIYLKKLYNLPVLLCLISIMFLFIVDHTDINIKRALYTISINLKETTIFLIPYIISIYMMTSMVNLGQKTYNLIAITVISIIISTLFTTFVVYGVSLFSYRLEDSILFNKLVLSDSLKPFWKLNLPSTFTSEKGILIGVFIGIICRSVNSPNIKHAAYWLAEKMTNFLNNFFIALVPFFVTGFLFKLEYEGILNQLFETYTPFFLNIFLIQGVYILFLYIVAAKFNSKQLAVYLKNIFPSAITAFCTMSSVATIPVTIQGAEKNTGDTNLCRFLIPATANIHHIGESISIPIMVTGIMLSFGFEFPSFLDYMIFAIQFVIAKLFIPAVPGGSLIVMIPLIENYLGFSPELTPIISVFYILCDSVSTAINVTGNGVLAIFVSLIEKKFMRKYL